MQSKKVKNKDTFYKKKYISFCVLLFSVKFCYKYFIKKSNCAIILTY